MVICFYCPTGHPLSVNAALAGKRVRCGLCGQTAIVPIPHTGPARRPGSSSSIQPKMPATPRDPNKKSLPAIRPINKPISKTVPVVKTKPLTATPNLTPVVKAPTLEVPEPVIATSAAVPIMPTETFEPILAEFAEPTTLQSPDIPQSPGIPLTPDVIVTADACETCPADARQVLLLAGGIAVAALAMLLPIFIMGHARLWRAPAWTQCVVLLTAMQLAYALWMASAPDWTTVRVMTIVCAITAALYAVAMAMTLVTPINHSLMLGLNEVRRGAPFWCLFILIVMSGLSWACSRVAGRWRREAAMSRGQIAFE